MRVRFGRHSAYTRASAQRFGRVRVLPYKEALRLAWGGGLIDG
ncbi:MAG: hypothetical protein OXF72_04480 [Gammaproteobacteria bacterium]|nr:hypothetical protein [Gammaproteobacteria bacterium]MCY4199135.1 hypothetical protein [Gammaproteobacteria bacterium]MCY4276807.1 hypothetical protein [Gammaproteobacteria bacterium]